MSKNSIKSSVSQAALETLSREELAAVAKSLGLAVGKSKSNSIANIVAGANAGKVHFKTQFTVSFKPDGGSRMTYFGKTMRNYVSGPGQSDETWLTPDKAIAGSPADGNGSE